MKYFAKIKYLGTAFHGFQVQPEKRTVQGELCQGLREALGVPCKVTGCSRTDAGVHANEFCLTVDAEGATVPPEKLPLAVARFLPNDLSLFYAKECDADFHPRYDVKEKEYLYRIINTPIYDPFDFGRAWFVPRKITDDGLERMNEAAKNIIGKRDFSAFMSEGSDTEDTVRNVTSLTVERRGDLVEIKICADGFLYNMVRIIVGTLLEVAFGRFSPDYVAEVVASENRQKAGPTAPPDGLYLNRVIY
jgi:tRNA pseudouridine38-40 synthase